MEKLLGEGTSFEDVEKLRKQLVSVEMRIFERKEKITNLNEEMGTGKAKDLRELKIHRINLTNDKEQQKEMAMTKKDWETYIKKELTYQDEQDIHERYRKYDDKIASMERKIKLDRIYRDNLRWKLVNRLTYVQAILGSITLTEQIGIKMEGK